MNKIILTILMCSTLAIKAQNYTFSKSSSAYVNLTSSTIIDSSYWDYIESGIHLPFTFKYWGKNYADSIYVDDFGSISLDYNYNEEISFLNEDLISNGDGRSIVSYKVEGIAPNRIFKLEYKDVGFDLDAQAVDSANVQCWIYETSNIIEYRYGPNKVKPSSWNGNGAFVGVINENLTKFMILEGNPANPTQNTTDILNSTTLNGMPSNGTIYKFAPTGGTGLDKNTIQINIIGNTLVVPASVQVNTISLYNITGQLVHTYTNVSDVKLADLNHGLYIVVLDTAQGMLTQKLIL